jgi:hypothetical protein
MSPTEVVVYDQFRSAEEPPENLIDFMQWIGARMREVPPQYLPNARVTMHVMGLPTVEGPRLRISYWK